MPALPSGLLLSPFVAENISSSFLETTNDTSDALQVICAWPLSGQYGFGTRVLYYVLITACLLAVKIEWIRNASVAAALIFPAVAAIHGIVLAAVHENGAIDMDIFGAFQICSIGIMAAPVTLISSQTYFRDPGRNTIFLWTLLMLAGLLSLMVEFWRASPSSCTQNSTTRIVDFLKSNNTCNLICSIEEGPVSPMRRGAANNIYVIPAPEKLDFGLAVLLAAACCVHAILWLVVMLDKIVEVRRRRRSGITDDNVPLKGTNGATRAMMKGVNNRISFYRNMVMVPVYLGAGLAMLIAGERNFWSPQVKYQTEPMASIGQWAPFVGTTMAVLGSGYLMLAEKLKKAVGESGKSDKIDESDGVSDQEAMFRGSLPRNPDDRRPRISIDISNIEDINNEQRKSATPTPNNQTRQQPDNTPGATSLPNGQVESQNTRLSSRQWVARKLEAFGDSLGANMDYWFDSPEMRSGRAGDYPVVPGETNRNENLAEKQAAWAASTQNSGGNVTPRSSLSLTRERSRSQKLPSSARKIRTRSATVPPRRTSLDPPPVKITPPPHPSRKRGDTLEIPPIMQHSPLGLYHRPPIASTSGTKLPRENGSTSRDIKTGGHRVTSKLASRSRPQLTRPSISEPTGQTSQLGPLS